MEIQSSNYKISINKTIRQLLVLYFISLIFTYPYGIEIINDNFIRFPDLIAIAITSFSVSCWLLLGKSRLKIRPLLPILPFLILELLFPIIGAFYYGSMSDSLSSARVLLLYLPVTICILKLGNVSAYKLDLKLEKLFKIAVIINLIYCIIQLAVGMGLLPEFLLITNSLESWAADSHFNQLSGLRVSGFFVNVSALAAFGIITMSYFLAKFQVKKQGIYLVYLMTALLLIMLSTSRNAYIVAALIIFLSLITSGIKRSFKLAITIIISVVLLIILLNLYLELDYDVFFSRFIRVQEQGLEQDYSWSTRVEDVWPMVLSELRKYPWGTFIPSFKVLGIIDSGYLTYYAQGKWIFIAGLVSSFVWILIASFRVKNSQKNWAVFFLRYLLVYISPAMVVNNPMRSPFVIFALLYGLWFLSIDKQQFFKKSVPTYFLSARSSLSEVRGQ
ncbi:membrane hypothetical protein [Hyella patelloides LEGE 07179]|uniref:O-antigen polymerase n=1 Tax=Hyella patelloides LEGE 07179 TaxID=945734 RepID=A0A563VP44_9CYAN|nr:hypothetical protein [Hyella patelloides]VEP13238.1 membrane hypothetical protein [Hyella patelloides LEGE 07179]